MVVFFVFYHIAKKKTRRTDPPDFKAAALPVDRKGSQNAKYGENTGRSRLTLGGDCDILKSTIRETGIRDIDLKNDHIQESMLCMKL